MVITNYGYNKNIDRQVRYVWLKFVLTDWLFFWNEKEAIKLFQIQMLMNFVYSTVAVKSTTLV
jgi:hypothetical protein